MSKLNIIILIIYLFSGNLIQAEDMWHWEKAEIDSSLNDDYYLDVMFLESDPDYGWACGYNTILRTTNGGEYWTGVQNPDPGNLDLRVTYADTLHLETIQFLNKDVGYCSGPYGLLKSTNGGRSWFDITPVIENTIGEDLRISWWGTHFIDENTGLLPGTYPECFNPEESNSTAMFFMKTTNGGESWYRTEYNYPDTYMFSKSSDPLFLGDGKKGYIVSSGVLWESDDYGESWDFRSFTFEGSPTVYNGFDWHEEIDVEGNTILLPYVPGCSGTYERGGIRVSNDGGESWNYQSFNQPMFGTFLLDSLRGWASGFRNSIYYTSDGGKNWEKRACDNSEIRNFDDIYFIDDSTGWVTGEGLFTNVFLKPYEAEISHQELQMCKGDTIQLSVEGDYKVVKWNTGESDSLINVTDEGKYFAYTEKTCQSDWTDTVEVSYLPMPKINEAVSGFEKDHCIGDTVTLKFENDSLDYLWSTGSDSSSTIITETGTYSVTAVNEYGCSSTEDFEIVFHENPEVFIELNRTRRVCVGDSLTLEATPGYSRYEWFPEGIDSLLGTKDYLKVYESGSYVVIAYNEYGCNTTSEQKEVNFALDTNDLQFTIEKPNEMAIDSTVYPNMNCGNSLNIKNISNETVTLNNALMLRNIEFSVPQAQFPITIFPNDSVKLEICYKPSDLEQQRDTLVFFDDCSDRFIPLVSAGKGYAVEGEAPCDTYITYELVDIVDKYFVNLSRANPNPASKVSVIQFSAGLPESKEEGITYLELYDSYGQNIRSIAPAIKNIRSLKKGKIITGEFKISLSNLENGVYFAVIFNGEKHITKKVIVAK